ncbi:histidine kinase [Aquimarina sp. AD1]|uniref:tetratricopeptide repeat-containing sensor histidine kinase n=1 Tax=Aquimarina sp. (strain AD1) TaxID=1714848 RepID=UPI000E551602|nr:tetratricopeptide repeat protein [Aquimarina sp. AD1]AXT58400.1 histidine kinase [Aquimarina sp. AD1]RKN24937.1 histidine kinase [Aquimarina sp. AD1]
MKFVNYNILSYLKNSIAIVTLLFSLNIQGQIDVKKTFPYSYKGEREIINELKTISNIPDRRKESYLIAKEQLHKKAVKSDRFKADLSLIISSYFRSISQIDSVKYYGQKILELNNFKNDTLKNNIYGLAYFTLGQANSFIGLNEKSKKWYFKGINISQQHNDERIYYVNSFGLANVYIATSEYDLALEILEKCQEYKKNPEMVFGSIVNIANIYGYKEEFDKAIEYFEKAREICIKANRTSCIGTISINMGITYKKIGALDKSLVSFDKALEIAKANNFERMQIIGSVEKGRLLNELKRYQEAEDITLSALDIATKIGFLNEQEKIYFRLKEIAVSKNDYKKALSYYEHYDQISDSARTLDKDKEINELEVKYKTLQKEKEIRFLQIENTNKQLELANQQEAISNLKLVQEIENKEYEILRKENENKLLTFQNTTEKALKDNIILKKNQELKDAQLKIQQDETAKQKVFKNIILYSFLILLVPVIGLLVTYYQKIKVQSELNQKQKEINETKISSLLKDQELKVIKASVEGQDKERKRIAQELHDSIGGNLAAIKLQLNNSDQKNQSTLKAVNTQIDDTYELVRDLSHNLIPKKFSKNNFSDVLEEYFSNIGGASKLKTGFSVYPRRRVDLLEETLQVETFKIIQELVTNSIKHAKASSIALQINLLDNELNILFEDDGVGFDVNKNTEGIGFRNIRSRLDKIDGTIDIDSRIKRGTIINIAITSLTTTTDEVQPNYS